MAKALAYSSLNIFILSQDESEWAVIEPLPSYGRGRDTEGGRYISLIFGTNLTDVVITGIEQPNLLLYQKLLSSFRSRFRQSMRLTLISFSGDNGTIDGQGQIWWDKFHKGELQYTRPYLIELLYSENIQISNITLVNSPSWNIHPTYSR